MRESMLRIFNKVTTILEKKILPKMANWPFWITMGGIGLAVAYILLLSVFKRQARDDARTAQAAAIQASQQKASSISQVNGCFVSVHNSPVSQGFLDAHEAIIENSIISTTAALATTKKSDPLYQIRKDSLKRLDKALDNLNELRKLIDKNTPTLESCIKLANKLGVPVPKGAES